MCSLAYIQEEGMHASPLTRPPALSLSPAERWWLWWMPRRMLGGAGSQRWRSSPALCSLLASRLGGTQD